jgi:hypothetical protein
MHHWVEKLTRTSITDPAVAVYQRFPEILVKIFLTPPDGGQGGAAARWPDRRGSKKKGAHPGRPMFVQKQCSFNPIVEP